jgi:hypothetical protein
MPYLVLFEALEPIVEILFRLTIWGLVESVWFRPPMAWWRLKATLFALIGRRPGWSTIPRGATLEQPTQAVAPLTR